MRKRYSTFTWLVPLGMLCALALALPGTAAAKNCADRNGGFVRHHQGLLVLKHRALSCKTIRTVALRLLNGAHQPGRIDGLHCRRDNKVQAGGGATRCTLGKRKLVEYGWE